MNMTKRFATELIELTTQHADTYEPSEQVRNGIYLAELVLNGAARANADNHGDIYRAWQEVHYQVNNNR